MASRELTAVDWSQPWFGAVAWAGERLPEADLALCDRLNRLLTKGDLWPDRGDGVPSRPRLQDGTPILFAPQSDLPDGVAYESHIRKTGRIPTREGAHDLFNGLEWLAFPRTKSRLNAIQGEALERQVHAPPPGTGRGSVRDAATLFDENGLVLACANDGLAEALRRFDWHTLFIERRTATLMQTEPWVLGHGLLEKLMNPYKSITAHALIVPVDDSYFRSSQVRRRAMIDRLVSDWLDNWPFFTPRDLSPLPVLGLPGWWPANTQQGFYDDADVFRSGRSRLR